MFKLKKKLKNNVKFFGHKLYCVLNSALYTNTTTVMCPILNVRETCLSVDASESYEETCHKAWRLYVLSVSFYGFIWIESKWFIRSINSQKAVQVVPGNDRLAANLMTRSWNSPYQAPVCVFTRSSKISIPDAVWHFLWESNNLTYFLHFFWLLQQQTIRLSNRRLMGSTDQADPSCIYFRISWILMERPWFYFFCPLHLLQGLRSTNIK